MIPPIEDCRFSLGTLHQAERLARTDPAQLTDLHLRHLVIYAPDDAERALRARDAALDDARLKALQPPPPAPPPAPPAFDPEAFADCVIDAIACAVDPVTARVDALTARLEEKSLRDEAYRIVIDRAKALPQLTEHTAQLAQMEARVRELQARVLELEAQVAVPHVHANH